VEDCPYSERVCTCTYTPQTSLGCTFLHPLGYLESSTTSTTKLASMTCECDRSRPAAPEDCAYAQQFTCKEYAPEYEDCTCYGIAPRSKEDCAYPTYFQCAWSDPLLGCDCIRPIH